MRRITSCVLALLLAVALDWADALPPYDHAASAQLPLNSAAAARLQNAAAALGNGTLLDTSGATAVIFQTSGTFSATVTFEGTVDGTNFQSLTCYTLDSATATTTTTTANMVRCNVLGIPAVRARVSTYTSGSVTVFANASAGAFPGVRDAQLNTLISATGATNTQGQLTATPPAGGVSPTCSTIGCHTVLGSDGMFVVDAQSPVAGHGVIVVNFSKTLAAAPNCTASMTSAYTGQYVDYVTASTTQVILALPIAARAFSKYAVLCFDTTAR